MSDDSEYEFYLDGADEPFALVGNEVQRVTEHITMCDDLVKSLKKNEDTSKYMMLMDAFSMFEETGTRLQMLIDIYQEDTKLLYTLLQLHEKMTELTVFCSKLKSSHTSDDNNGHTEQSDDEEEIPLSRKNDGKGKDRVIEQDSDSELESAFKQEYSDEPSITFVKERTIPCDKPKVGYKAAEKPGLCPICYEDDIAVEKLCVFEQCDHQYCKECLQGYFDNLIKDNKITNITCPNPSCSTVVEYNQVKDVVAPSVFEKYEEFVLLATLNADPSVKWCPKPGCGNAIIGDPANPKCICTSPECKFEFCFNCSEAWHDGSCEQFQQWKAENGLVDKKFSRWAKRNTKKCPNCKTPIEKMSGCNHMTCGRCSYEFCWLCNGRYTASHFDVFNVLGCPGMQSGSKNFGIAKRMGMRTLIGTGLVLGGVIGTALAIPAVVVGGPIYLGFMIQKKIRRRRSSRYNYNY